MKNEIKEYFKKQLKDINTRCGHPYYNNSMLRKVGNKYLYFMYKKQNGSFMTVKMDMNLFYSNFCRWKVTN